MSSLITPTIDLDRDGMQTGYLRLPHSVHRSAYGFIPIPIASLKNGDGPRVLLMGGTHGDEYEGQVILSSLIRTLPLDQVTGQIIILPMANFPAAEAGLRTSPLDDGNLNRAFRAWRAARRPSRSPIISSMSCCPAPITCLICIPAAVR